MKILDRAQSLFLALAALVRPGVNFQAYCRNLRRRVKNFRRTASNTWSIYPKRIVTLQKERLGLRVAIWAYSSSIEHNESKHKNQNISYARVITSRFVQYPHYPIACCLPHLSTVDHNCHGKSINLTAKRKRLTAKRITSPCGKKKKTRGKKKNLATKRKRLAAKFLRYREDILILISFAVRSLLFFFAVRLFFLP